MHTIQNVAGRLVEVRVAPPLSLEEIEQFVREHRQVIGEIPERYVGVVDLQHANVFPPEVTDRLIQLLSVMGDRVERSAFLIGASAVLALQIERVIRTAANPNRRAFRDPGELCDWLGEILTPRERARLAQVFGAGPGFPAAPRAAPPGLGG